MSYLEKHRFAGSRTEQAMLKVAWEGCSERVDKFISLPSSLLQFD
jgi:hypothetical protein